MVFDIKHRGVLLNQYNKRLQAHFIIGSQSYGGSYKITIVCLSVHLLVQRFSQKWPISFFWFFAQWQILGTPKNWQSPFFLNLSKRAQNNPKIEFFWFFEKILSLVFLVNNLKWKLILLLIFHHQSHTCQNSGSQIMGQNALSQSNYRIL